MRWRRKRCAIGWTLALTAATVVGIVARPSTAAAAAAAAAPSACFHYAHDAMLQRIDEYMGE